MSDGDYVAGVHAVTALLETAPERISRLWVQAPPRSKRLGALAAQARAAGVQVDAVERRWLSQRAGDGVVHQGVLALQLETPLADERALLDHLEAALAGDTAPLLLVLDELQDARNLGACLRSAEAAGVTAVVVPKRRSAPLNSVARRAAAGAAERLFVAAVTNLPRTLSAIKERGVWVYGADASADTAWTGADFGAPTALVLGAEGSGLRRLVREHCDGLLAIPMAGAVSSLNVSVAAALLLFEAVRQRGGGLAPEARPP